MSSKGLYILYGCLLLSVYYLRSLEINTNKTLANFLETRFHEVEDSFNITSSEGTSTMSSSSDQRRNLQTATGSQTQNAMRVKICAASSDNGTVSSSQKSKADSERTMYRNSFGASLGDDILNQKMPSVSGQVQKIIILAILVIFFILTPLITWCYCCYCCCNKKCPLCCKNDFQKNPITKGQMIFSMVMLFIFAAMTFSTSIAGYVYSNDINSSYKSMKCTIVSALDNLNLKQTFTTSGGASATFLGLNNLSADLSNIMSEFNTYFASVQSFATSSATAMTKINKYSDTIVNMLTSMKVTALATPYPNAGAGVCGWEDLVTVGTPQKSIFFDSTNYPALINTMISAQNTATSSAISSMQSASSQCASFASSGASSISGPLTTAQKSITDGQKMLSDAINTINDNSSATDTVFNLITIILMVFYGIFMFISVASAALVFIGHLKNMYKVRYCFNVFFCVLGILTFIGFLITIVLCVLSIMMMEGCDAGNKYLNDPTYLQTVNLGSADLKSYLTTCKAELGGDGNILKKFNIDSQINSMTSTQQSLQDAVNSFTLSSYQTFEQYMTYFQYTHKMIETYGVIFARSDQNWSTVLPNQMGTYTMSLDYTSASTAFTTQTNYLNFQTTSSNSYSNCINTSDSDQFVFQSNQCTSYGFAAANIKSAAQFPNPLTAKDCVSWDTISAAATNANCNTRYVGANCNNAIYTNFYSRIANYVTCTSAKYGAADSFSYNNKITATNPQVDNVVRSTFVTNIKTYQSSVLASNGLGDQLRQYVADINSVVLNGSTAISSTLLGTNGLLTQINCLFFGVTMDQFYNQICDNSAITIYITFKIFAILCFSNFVFLIYLYKISIKFLAKQTELDGRPNNATVMPGQQQEMQKLF